MNFDVGEVLITIVDRSEFALAREAIAGFEPWASYDDYRSERDGRLIGLAAAGLSARLAPVSVRAFLEWSQFSDVAPTLSQLDAFAAKDTAISPFPVGARRSPDPTTTLGGDFSVDPPTGVAVHPASYRAWLDCLHEQPSDGLYAAYVALIVESAGERSRPSAIAD